MPDSLPVFGLSPIEAHRQVGHNHERRSACSGLPIFSTELLNQLERETLRKLARALRLAADRVDEAVERGRVEHGLEALQLADAVGQVTAQAAAQLGKHR